MKKVKDKTKGIDVVKGVTSNRGITLIALIITIIVLLLLTGVVITLSLSDNGIFYWAKQARNLTNKQEATDRMNLKILTAQTNKYAENQEMPTLKELSEILKEDEEIQYITEASKVASVEYDVTSENPTSIYVKLKKYSYEFEINSQLKLAKIDGKEVTDSNQKPGGDDQTGIKPGESGYAGGSYDDPYIPKGFKHIGEDTWNSGYTIIGEESKGIAPDEFVWVPCVVEGKSIEGVEVFKKTLPTTEDKADPLNKYRSVSMKLLPQDEEVEEEDPSVSAIERSVEKYGGFYIAKYEAGIDVKTGNYQMSTSKKKPVDGSFKPLSQKDKGVWNGILRKDAIVVAKAMINTEDGIHSTLISGAAWDTTLQWMVNSSDNKDENKGYDINSEGKGWYKDKASTYPHLTGYYAINNIYDMAGNVLEMTSENSYYSNSNYFVARGGQQNYTGVLQPAAIRLARSDSSSELPSNLIGFRVMLYKD